MWTPLYVSPVARLVRSGIRSDPRFKTCMCGVIIGRRLRHTWRWGVRSEQGVRDQLDLFESRLPIKFEAEMSGRNTYETEFDSYTFTECLGCAPRDVPPIVIEAGPDMCLITVRTRVIVTNQDARPATSCSPRIVAYPVDTDIMHPRRYFYIPAQRCFRSFCHTVLKVGTHIVERADPDADSDNYADCYECYRTRWMRDVTSAERCFKCDTVLQIGKLKLRDSIDHYCTECHEPYVYKYVSKCIKCGVECNDRIEYECSACHKLRWMDDIRYRNVRSCGVCHEPIQIGRVNVRPNVKRKHNHECVECPVVCVWEVEMDEYNQT